MIEKLKKIWERLTYQDPYEAIKLFSTAHCYDVSEETIEELERMIEDYRQSIKESDPDMNHTKIPTKSD